jgi:hypothetical protein
MLFFNDQYVVHGPTSELVLKSMLTADKAKIVNVVMWEIWTSRNNVMYDLGGLDLAQSMRFGTTRDLQPPCQGVAGTWMATTGGGLGQYKH